jgi:hypothetical protein
MLMIQNDYILRPLFQLINEIISKFSEVKFEHIKKREEHINNLYLKYLEQDRLFFIETDVDSFINDKLFTNEKLMILAEMFYCDSLQYKDKGLKTSLLKKAREILKHISTNDGTYSIERENKIKLMEKEISLNK